MTTKLLEHFKKFPAAYFGLGFIQIKVDENSRYHFYHPDLLPILDEEELHNHRYDFKSTVLKGSLENQLYYAEYSKKELTDYELRKVSCSPKDDSDPILSMRMPVRVVDLGSFIATPNSPYTLTTKVFHRIKYSEPTITFLERGPTTTKFASVVSKVGEPEICPFSKVMDEAEIWRIVEDIVNG